MRLKCCALHLDGLVCHDAAACDLGKQLHQLSCEQLLVKRHGCIFMTNVYSRLRNDKINFLLVDNGARMQKMKSILSRFLL